MEKFSVKFNDSSLGTETVSSMPSNANAPPKRPVVHDAPLMVPLLLLSDSSNTLVPVPSFIFQRAEYASLSARYDHSLALPPVFVAVQSTLDWLVNVRVVAVVDKSGVGSVMVTVMFTVSFPPLFVPVTVWTTAVVWFTVGVPEITPSTRLMPLGKGGLTLHSVTVPPALDTVRLLIATSLVPVMVVWSELRSGGA